MTDRAAKISVAPMMDWTDAHCRFFLRGFSPRILLYTEMITSAALVRGRAERLLDFDAAEHPVALQLGGSDPHELAKAAKLGAARGYDEINLNCGCPSDRVVAGTFGACLMNEPARVADCVRAMRDAVDVPVTVKMRIGTIDATSSAVRADLQSNVQRFDDRDYDALCDFIRCTREAGSAVAIVHARKAVLGAWSPKENREIPPLRYDIVSRLKREFGEYPIVLNGGLRDVQTVEAVLAWCDGAMLGREAYHHPMILDTLHRTIFDPQAVAPSRVDLLARMTGYAAKQMARGVRLPNIARHVLGLYSHEPGAREFRRTLSEGARAPDAVPELFVLAGQCAESASLAATR